MARALGVMLLLTAAPLLAQKAVTPNERPPGSVHLADDADGRWIAFDLTPANQILFRMTVDGRPATAILDTGASFSVLSRRFAGVNPARVRPGGTAAAIGGTVTIGWLPTDTVSLGGLTRTGGGMVVADLPARITGGAQPVDLLVGRDLTVGVALDIDYPARRFRLLPSGRLPFQGSQAPLTISPVRQVYEGEAVLRGRRLRPMIVDTGDGSGVTITPAEWTAARPNGVPVTTAIAYGLGGSTTVELAIVPLIRVGTLSARNVEVRVEPADGASRSIGAAGRIGSGFLGRYRVLLDPGASRMVLRPGPDADRPPPRSTSGLVLGLARDRLRVLHVMRGSPAEQAGWKTDNTICAVDGRAIDPGYAADPAAGWTAGEPGRIVRLTECTPGSRPRPLTLRRFY